MAHTFSHIVLAYDDSPGSRIALEYACALTHDGATLTVAHAVDEAALAVTAMTATEFGPLDPTPLITAVDERGAEVLQSAVDACAARGVAAERVFIHDAAARGISSLVDDGTVDLVVVGTHGRGGIAHAALGSVAEGILRASAVPVLVLTGHAPAPRGAPLFERALVAIDDSLPAQAAVAVAARLSAGESTHLTLCTVIDSRDLLAKSASYGYDPRPLEADLHATATALLERARASAGTRVDAAIAVEGEPAQTIEHTAMQRNCGLIVIGSHVRRGLERLLFGSVAEAVMRGSAVPVLVVPSHAR
jgi:nucleotide-binding universal stress UspA family protein